MKTAALLTFFIAVAALGFSAQRPRAQYCTPDSKDEGLRCMCLSYHADFCSEEGPIPSCCKATEKGSKAHDCHCCKGRPADPKVRGTYLHVR